MNSATVATLVLVALIAAIFVGRNLRRLVPVDHVSSDSRDTVKLALSLVATMTALVLGLLVSSAKDSFDTERREVIQMAANVVYLDRLLAAYGEETNAIREKLRATVGEAIHLIWPEERNATGTLAADETAGNQVFAGIERLSPRDDSQRDLKSQARDVAFQLGQTRSLLSAQAVASISTPMLLVLLSWLVIIFLGFSLLAPRNATVTLALLFSAVCTSAAIFLIFELDQSFSGIIRISSQPMRAAERQMAQSASEIGSPNR
jgi:hypothetical protein